MKPDRLGQVTFKGCFGIAIKKLGNQYNAFYFQSKMCGIQNTVFGTGCIGILSH